MVAIETGKTAFSIIVGLVARTKKCFIKNMNYMDSNYH